MLYSTVPTQDSLQTLSASVNASASVLLVVITLFYTIYTYKLLRLSLDNSRRDWTAELHVSLISEGDKVMARLTNLGRTAILADTLTTQAGEKSPVSHSLDKPIQAGKLELVDITRELLACKNAQPGVMPKTKYGRSVLMSFTQDQILVSVSVGFYAQGSYHHSEPAIIAISSFIGGLGPVGIANRSNIEIPPVKYAWYLRPMLWWYAARMRIGRKKFD